MKLNRPFPIRPYREEELLSSKIPPKISRLNRAFADAQSLLYRISNQFMKRPFPRSIIRFLRRRPNARDIYVRGNPVILERISDVQWQITMYGFHTGIEVDASTPESMRWEQATYFATRVVEKRLDKLKDGLIS